MDKNVSPYIKYLISNLVLINDWIEKFGVGDDDKIIKHTEQIAKDIDSILNDMKSLGIDTDQLHNESYDIEENIRDFKLKRILTNEGN